MLLNILANIRFLLSTKSASQRVFPIENKEARANTNPLFGICPVCGKKTIFVNFTQNLRESGFCKHCGSFNRQRQIAFIIRQQLNIPLRQKLIFDNEFIIYNTESTGAVHKALNANKNYLFSEYWGRQYQPGEIVNGVRHEDICNLSFDDNSLDLVLSSDILEHMPDPYRAHQEVFRVLKPGGRHIFTVPFYHDQTKDEIRAKMENGEIVHLHEPVEFPRFVPGNFLILCHP